MLEYGQWNGVLGNNHLRVKPYHTPQTKYWLSAFFWSYLSEVVAQVFWTTFGACVSVC